MHEKLSTRCTRAYSGNFTKRWYSPIALLELKRRRRSIYSSDNILKILAETKTAEDINVSLSPQARDDTRVHTDSFPTSNERRQTFFVGGDNIVTEGNDEGVSFTATVQVGNNVFAENFPKAAMVVGKGQNLYSRNIFADEHRDKRRIAGPFYPFSGKEDWSTFKWLSSLQVPMEKLDEFFELPYVCHFLLHQSMILY